MVARSNPWATGSPSSGVTDATQLDLLGSPNYVWDSGSLSWVKMTQPTGGGGGGAVTQGTIPWITSEQLATYTPISGTVSTAGDNTIITPGGGLRIRMYYIALSAAAGNSGSVVVSVRAGAASPWYKVELVPGAIYARNVGAGKF